MSTSMSIKSSAESIEPLLATSVYSMNTEASHNRDISGHYAQRTELRKCEVECPPRRTSVEFRSRGLQNAGFSVYGQVPLATAV